MVQPRQINPSASEGICRLTCHTSAMRFYPTKWMLTRSTVPQAVVSSNSLLLDLGIVRPMGAIGCLYCFNEVLNFCRVRIVFHHRFLVR
jgi:hypothetical protein